MTVAQCRQEKNVGQQPEDGACQHQLCIDFLNLHQTVETTLKQTTSHEPNQKNREQRAQNFDLVVSVTVAKSRLSAGKTKRHQRDEEATDIRQHVSRIGEDGNGP